MWTKGHQNGFFYGLGLGFPTYKKFESLDSFKKVKEKDTKLWRSALKKSVCKVDIALPKMYNKKKAYPLLIVFHGGGSSNVKAAKKWKSELTSTEYIIAFIQSYLHYDYESFGWKGYDPRAREDIKKIYSDIVKKYKIDKDHIVVGGISAGSVMAIDLAINNIIPVNGFIGVCALTPKKFDDQRVNAAKKRGLRGVFISGEKDFGYKKQKNMEKIFKKHQLLFRFMFNKGLGHNYPKDFFYQLGEALQFLRYKKDIALEYIKVEQAIKNTIGWAKEKDLKTLYKIIADDKNYIEIHPNNRVVKGIKDFKKAEAFWMNKKFKHVGFDVSDLKINFSTSGKIAWYYCILNDYNTWEGKPVNWENTRWTGVLEKEDGNWKMKQMHFSYANKN